MLTTKILVKISNRDQRYAYGMGLDFGMDFDEQAIRFGFGGDLAD